MQPRTMLVLAAGTGGSGVLLGAFAAHGLKDSLPAESLTVFETAVRYQMYHAFALGLCGLLGRSGVPLRAAAWSFTAGIALFSGSLYLLACSGARWLGAVTPFGGIALLLGWMLLGMAALRARP